MPCPLNFLRGDFLKIYDCFTFYNEFELLELRLKSLYDVVDYFVIAEADRTHANKPKPYYFWERQNEFKEFFPKIRHLPVEMTIDFKGVGDWSIENAQRDATAYGLYDAAPDDLVMISDLDEIPAPDILQAVRARQVDELLEKNPLVMKQVFFYYYFDCVRPSAWYGTVLVKHKNLTTPQHMRNIKNTLPRLQDGGWHFSYMGGVDRVINKMTSIVDGNAIVVNSGGKLIDRKHVEEALTKGTDIYGRQSSAFRLQPYDARNIRLPHLEEFLRKYPHFLREPEKYFGGLYGK